MSDMIPIEELTKRIAKAMGEIEAIPRNGENTHHRYHYATIDDVYDGVRQALANNGLAVSQSEVSCEIASGRLVVKYDIGFMGGPVERVTVSGKYNSGSEAQSHQTLASYAMKYWLRSKLLLSTGERDNDDQQQDGNLKIAPKPPVPRKQGDDVKERVKKAVETGVKRQTGAKPAAKLDESEEIYRVFVDAAKAQGIDEERLKKYLKAQGFARRGDLKPGKETDLMFKFISDPEGLRMAGQHQS